MLTVNYFIILNSLAFNECKGEREKEKDILIYLLINQLIIRSINRYIYQHFIYHFKVMVKLCVCVCVCMIQNLFYTLNVYYLFLWFWESLKNVALHFQITKTASLPLTAWFLIQSLETWAIFRFDPESFDIKNQSAWMSQSRCKSELIGEFDYSDPSEKR